MVQIRLVVFEKNLKTA